MVDNNRKGEKYLLSSNHGNAGGLVANDWFKSRFLMVNRVIARTLIG